MLDEILFAHERRTNRIALATGSETIASWTIPDEGVRDEPEWTVETSRSRMQGMAFVGPERLLTVHELGSVVLWQWPSADTEEATPEVVWERRFELEPCAFARSFSSSGAIRVAIGDRRGRLIMFVFEGSDEPSLGVADAHESDVTDLTFATDGHRLASAGRDRLVRVWSTALDSSSETTLPAGPGEGIDLSDETATSRQEGEDAPTSPETPPEGDGAPAEGKAPEEGGEAGSNASSKVSGTEVPSGAAMESIATLEGSQGWPLTLAFDGSAERIAAGSMDNGVYLWDLRDDDPLQAATVQHNNWITDLDWSPEESRLASGSWDATVGLFKTENLEATYRFQLHADFVSTVHFVPDTDVLISASYDGSLAFWNWQNGELQAHREGHDDWIETLHPLSDDRVATISSDATIRIWDVDSQESVARLGDAVEAFDLGRGVDFSDYIDLEELATDELGEPDDTPAVAGAVHELGGEDRPGSGGDDSAQTAVGLLEHAIDESERGEGEGVGNLESPDEQEGQAPSEEDSAKLLEAQLDGHDVSDEDDEDEESSEHTEDNTGADPDASLEPDDIDVSSSPGELEDRIRNVEEENFDLVSPDMEVGDEEGDEEESIDLTDSSPDDREASGASEVDDLDPDVSVQPSDADTTTKGRRADREGAIEPDVSAADASTEAASKASARETRSTDSSASETETETSESEDDDESTSASAKAEAAPGRDDASHATSDRDTSNTAETPDSEGSEPASEASSHEEASPGAPEPSLAPGSEEMSDGEPGSTAPGRPAEASAPAGLNAGEETVQKIDGSEETSHEGPAPPTPDASGTEGESTSSSSRAEERTSTETTGTVDEDDTSPSPGEERSTLSGDEEGTLPPPSSDHQTDDMQSVGESDSEDEPSGSSPETSETSEEANTEPVAPSEETSRTTASMGSAPDGSDTASPRTSEDGDEVPRRGTEPMHSLEDEEESSDSSSSKRQSSEARADTARMGSFDEDSSDDSGRTGTKQMGSIPEPDSSGGDDTSNETGGGPSLPTPAEVDVPDDLDGAEASTESTTSSSDATAETSDASDSIRNRLSKLKDRTSGGETASSSDSETKPTSSRSDDPSEIEDTTASALWEDRPHPGRATDAPESETSAESSSDAIDEPEPSGTFEASHDFQTPHGWVYSVAQQPGGELVATCGGDGDVCLWSLSGQRRHALPTQSDGLNQVAFSPDGRIVAAAGDDTRLHLWLLPAPDPESTTLDHVRHTKLDEHDSWVTSVEIDSTGRRMITGSYDGTARLWQLEDGTCLSTLQGHETPVADVTFAGDEAVTVSHGGRVDIWSADGEPTDAFEGYDQISSVDASDDRIVWTTESGGVYVYDGIATTELQSHREDARDATIDERGAMATVGADARVYLYPPGEQTAEQVLRADAPLWCVHRRGPRVTIGDDDGRISVYER